MVRKVFVLLSLGRPLTSFLVALAIFSASFVSSGALILRYSPGIFIGPAIGLIFGVASNSINDYFDRNADRINHPERPIPSNKIEPQAALNFSLILFAVGISVALVLVFIVGFEALAVVLLAFVLQIAYEKKLKKIKLLGNVLIAFQTTLAFIFGGILVRNVTPTTIMATTAFLSILGREIVKDVEDIKGDTDKLTLPKIIGIKNANLIASGLILSAIVISLIAYYPLSIFGRSYFALVIVADVLFVYSFRVIFQNSNRARNLLKYAMLIALLAFVFGGFLK